MAALGWWVWLGSTFCSIVLSALSLSPHPRPTCPSFRLSPVSTQQLLLICGPTVFRGCPLWSCAGLGVLVAVMLWYGELGQLVTGPCPWEYRASHSWVRAHLRHVWRSWWQSARLAVREVRRSSSGLPACDPGTGGGSGGSLPPWKGTPQPPTENFGKCWSVLSSRRQHFRFLRHPVCVLILGFLISGYGELLHTCLPNPSPQSVYPMHFPLLTLFSCSSGL